MYVLIDRETGRPAYTNRIYRTIGSAKSARTNMFGSFGMSRAERRIHAEDRASIKRMSALSI